MSKRILLTTFVFLFLPIFLTGILSAAETSEYTVYKKESPAVINLLEDNGEQDFSGMPGKIFMGPQIANTVAPARQLCNTATTHRDYQHNSTIGRQLIYGGYYNAAFDYVYMIYTYSNFAATAINMVNYSLFDWGGTHNWDGTGICCDIGQSPNNSRYCNMDATPNTTSASLPVIAYHQDADATSPTYTMAGVPGDLLPCSEAGFTKDTLPGPPCVPDVQTGYCGDTDALTQPYIWPKIDVQFMDLVEPLVDSNIIHVASNEASACPGAPADGIEISSMVYYRKAVPAANPAYNATWSSPYFMDSSYSICQHVVGEKFGPNVYYVYLKPMYYYNGTVDHPCAANGMGHYQQTNDIVYKQSTDYGRTWGGRVNITEYGTYGFEDGNTEPANSDLTCMVDPNNVLHIVWGSANRGEDNICQMLYAMKMWHWDSFNNCISLAYDASKPTLFQPYLPRWDHVVTQQNIGWCDDKLYITFVRFGAHPVVDTIIEGDTTWASVEVGAGPGGADTVYQVADIMVVASDVSGGTGKSWTSAVNLTDTDGTNCASGSCEHEVYPFMAPYMNDSLMIEYIRDRDAGAWLVGEGARTDNPVMFMTWPCFTMAEVGTNCAYTVNPDPPEWPEVALAPLGNPAGCTTPATYSDSVILANGGNIDIVYSAVSDATWLTITSGAAGTASAGAGPLGLPNGCAAPAIIKWTASSVTLAAGNYTGTITVDIVDASCGDFDIIVNAVVACSYFEPEYARLTGGCWTVDVWNVPWAGHQGDNEGENWDGDIKFYACGGDSTVHPLYNEAFLVGWNDGTIKCYGQMMGEEFEAGMRALDSIQVSAVGNPAGGQGYWRSYGEWCTPDSLVRGTIEYFLPGHQDSAVLIEKVVLWNDGTVALDNFVAGEGIDWDVRDDSNYDAGGYDGARNMVYQRGCRMKDSVVAGLHCYYGHDALIGAAVVDNHDYIYDHEGYHPDSIYNLMTSLDGTFPVFQDSCTDMNSVYRFWEGTLLPQQVLKFCKVKAVSLDGVTGLQELIDKGVAYILIHNLCHTVEIPTDWPGGPGGLPPPGGVPGGGGGKHNEDGYKPPAGNPIGTQWHELWPVYCPTWTLTSWIDNGDGVLSHCDTVDFTNNATEQVIWEHIKVVTPTIIVEKVSQPGVPVYMDGLDENFDIENIDDPIATYWHEVYPDYGDIFHIVQWEDNGNGYLDSCDYIWLHALNGPDSCTTEEYHVTGVATDIISTPLPTPGDNKHNEDDYEPGDGDPTGTIWHELYPVYCQYWEVIEWIDNGDGILSYCDTLVSATETDTIREHVKLVTTTITVEEMPPTEPRYLDYLNYNPMNNDLPIPEVLNTYWHEVYPEYCTMYEAVDVIDNGNGYLDSCDIIVLHTISGPDSCLTKDYHVIDVATDIVTEPEQSCVGICGDANGDETVNVSDAVYIINYVFVSGPLPVPLACGDANSDGTVNVSDAVYIINYVFVSGPIPGDCFPGSGNWIDGDCCPFE